MITKARLFRATQVGTDQILAAIGATKEDPVSILRIKMSEAYGPLAHGFEVFFPEGWQPFEHPTRLLGAHILAGMQVTGFEIRDSHKVQTAVSTLDIGGAKEIDRIDGALLSELARMGVSVDGDGVSAEPRVDWYMHYEIKGN